MDLQHEFIVPTGVQQAWDHFQDIASVATCFPGAQVTSVEQDSFSGQVKVKLGPIAMVYTGTGRFVDRDEAAHSFVVEAKGRDKRGNGTAGATVTLTMTEQSPDSTAVTVLTDLAVTGKPAQFGRGVMQDVSDQLLGQFTACLERRLSTDGDAPAASDAKAGASRGSTAAASDPLSGESPSASSESTPLAAAAAASASSGDAPLLAASGAASVSAGGGPDNSAGSTGGSGGSANGSPLLAAASAPPVSAGPGAGGKAGKEPTSASGVGGSDPASSPADDEVAALDLGATVLPILIKGYWKQAVAATVATVLVAAVVKRLFGGSDGGN